VRGGHCADAGAKPADAAAVMVVTWRESARLLKREVFALYFAVRDPRVPWYAKALAACVVGYAFSPIDLIPDFIPVLGYLDELVLVPLGVWPSARWYPRRSWQIAGNRPSSSMRSRGTGLRQRSSSRCGYCSPGVRSSGCSVE
jgi:uncharacterized membrane protein YkvA (DUF1232 family)